MFQWRELNRPPEVVNSSEVAPCKRLLNWRQTNPCIHLCSPVEDPGVGPAAAGDHPVWLAAPLLSGECLSELASRGECNSLELFTDHCADTDYIIMGPSVGGTGPSQARVCVCVCVGRCGLFRVTVSAPATDDQSIPRYI